LGFDEEDEENSVGLELELLESDGVVKVIGLGVVVRRSGWVVADWSEDDCESMDGVYMRRRKR
jgi:hypothetical protein